VTLAAGRIDIEVNDFQSAVYAAELNAEGVRARKEGFAFITKAKYVGFYRLIGRAPLSNYSLYVMSSLILLASPPDGRFCVCVCVCVCVYIYIYRAELGEPHVIEYTESYPNEATATVLILTVELPNGANFSYKVERWDKPTYKNYFGWKMPVDATTIKTTQYFTNIPLGYRSPNSTIKAFVESDVTIQMIFRNGTSMGFADGDRRPFWFQEQRDFTTVVDPSNPPQYTASILPFLYAFVFCFFASETE
jgi:hypothetical protein